VKAHYLKDLEFVLSAVTWIYLTYSQVNPPLTVAIEFKMFGLDYKNTEK